MRGHLGFLLSVVAMMILVTACAQSSEPQVTAGPPASVAGTWTGSVGAGGQSTSVTMTLQQDGGAITGHVDVGGRSDLSGDLKGTVIGNALTYTLTSGYGSRVSLTVTGNRMQGPIGGVMAQLQKSG